MLIDLPQLGQTFLTQSNCFYIYSKPRVALLTATKNRQDIT